MMYRVSTLSADQSIEIRLSQGIYQILVQQAFEVLVSGSQPKTFDEYTEILLKQGLPRSVTMLKELNSTI
jgi:hypothetical protein